MRLRNELRNDISKDWQNIQDIEIPGLEFKSNVVELIEVHGFSGATLQGYGARIYLFTVCKSVDTSVNLLSVKSRIAPLKDATTQKKLSFRKPNISRFMSATHNAVKNVIKISRNFY